MVTVGTPPDSGKNSIQFAYISVIIVHRMTMPLGYDMVSPLIDDSVIGFD